MLIASSDQAPCATVHEDLNTTPCDTLAGTTTQFDWLIIGGGIHGVHMATRLCEKAGPSLRLGILDPAPQLLHGWRTRTQATGMVHLRSPAVHHLDPDPMSLLQFAKKWRKKMRESMFTMPYRRPSLKLFDAHCDWVLQNYNLNTHHIQARALRCEIAEQGIRVITSRGSTLHAQRIILAPGSCEHPARPDWAKNHGDKITHIFEPDSIWPQLSPQAPVAVVGGGISAGQTAMRFVHQGHRVHVVARHAVREHQFDSDPGWLGPKYLNRFHREPQLEKRREMIRGARHVGSMPADVRRSVAKARQLGQLTWHEGEISAAVETEKGLQLTLDSGPVEARHVFLATGFEPVRPGGKLVDDLVAQGLPTSPCGYPVVDRDLCWHPRIHVMGGLAELELGPAARNIAGARHAGDRIAATLT